MRFAIPRAPAREDRLPMLYSCIVYACARYGGVEFDERCQGAVCWLPDRHFPLGFAHLGNRDLFLIRRASGHARSGALRVMSFRLSDG